MKFEDSLFEERYNGYWNNTVVPLDTALRHISLGLNLFKNRASIPQLILAYQQNVSNILSNLDRQSYLFDDKIYVQNYMKNTVEQAVEDLTFYYKSFPESQEICSKYLKNFGIELSNVTSEITLTASK
ncbi:bile acid beta-glucosidase [Legionella wadsworthii]|uniref:Bile acid beta-glucosidase n=1 Tax=Legionella wadsworthii TaxID=28088 RepID=A0A378LQU9_9GAMM|nr:hypothetical protein [Legionella wadsworthii]STY29144.1 bile acid beta-glucosidase [Legionella wadsworthii]